MKTRKVILQILIFGSLLTAALAQDSPTEWTRFRGPNGSGHGAATALPVKWQDGSDNIAWQTTLPGEGASSPVIWKDRIYLTGYSGYNRWERGKDFSEFALHVAAFGLEDGAMIWETTIPHDEDQRIGGKGGPRWHGYASPSVAVDETGLYTSFGYNGFHKLDHAGEIVWSASIGDGVHNWGYAASPVLWEDLVIINASTESGKLLAFQKSSGDPAWDLKIGNMTWSTPLFAGEGDGAVLILNVRNGIMGVNPATGEQLWFVEGAKDYASNSPVLSPDGERLYYSLRNTHGGVCTLALKLKGEEDPELLWKRDDVGSVVVTPLLMDGQLYFSQVDGRTPPPARGFYALDAETGETLFHGQPEPMPKTLYASPVGAARRIYFPTLRSGIYVLEAGSEYNVLAHNTFAQDEGAFTASPVILPGNRILLRSDTTLYCLRANP